MDFSPSPCSFAMHYAEVKIWKVTYAIKIEALWFILKYNVQRVKKYSPSCH